MAYSCIRIRKSRQVAWITLNRPDTGNTITQSMAQEIVDACRQIIEDDKVNSAVITGAGDAFCAGSETEPARNRQKKGKNLCNVAAAVASIEKPVIAAINGEAIGQGLELALACDIRITVEAARFALPDIKQGLIPSDGGTQRLPRLIGKAKALELIFTGEIIGAQEAQKIGLVNRVVPANQLTIEVKKLAESIAEKAPIALRYIKEAINGGLDLTMEQGLRLEADLYYLIHTTSDRTEGIHSFMEKRRPVFKGK